MKMRRWIALLLIVVMTLLMVCSCKTKTGTEDDEAAVGEYVEQEETDNGDINSTPGSKDDKDDEDDNTDDPAEPDNGDDNTDDPADPDNGDDNTDDPADPDNGDSNTDDPVAPDNGDDSAPVEKESSGTPVTIMVQNLKTTGNQIGVQGERTDSLGRTGQANESYQRMRRFRENVKRVDPDVILTCEGTPCLVGLAAE